MKDPQLINASCPKTYQSRYNKEIKQRFVQIHLYKFLFTICLNLRNGFWILMGIQHEWPWLNAKGQPWPLRLVYSYFLIRLNIYYVVSIMILASAVFKKSIRKQIWPWRLVGQCQHRIIVLTNLVGLTFPMLHTKCQCHWHSGSGEKQFKGVLPYIGGGGLK